MAFRYLIAIAFVAVVVSGQTPNNLGRSIPGAPTAAAIAASSLNGMSQYFARDGPVVPAITAIGTVPIRGSEVINNRLTELSSLLDRQAQSLSRSATPNGQIRMPGLDTAESHMPESIASMGQTIKGAINRKNSWIRNQADQGIAAANRLGEMMSVRASQSMSNPTQMLSSAQDFLSKSTSTLQRQASHHLDGTMGRLSGVQGMGRQMLNQAQELSKTVSNGLQGAFGQLQRTGQDAMSQIQRDLQQNAQSISGVLSSLQGSMGQTHSNMQANMHGAMQQAQNTVQQLGSGLQGVAQAPMKVLENLQESLGGLMKGSSSSSGGRY